MHFGQNFGQRGNFAVIKFGKSQQILCKFFILRRYSQSMQANTHLHIFDICHINMQFTYIIIKICSFTFRNIFIQITFSYFIANHILNRAKISFSIIIIFKMTIFFQQLFQLCQFFICSRNTHRCGQITYKTCRAAPFCLDAFSDTGDPIWIDVGYIAGSNI